MCDFTVCKDERACAKGADEELALPNFACFEIDNGDAVTGVIDKAFFTGFVLLPHDEGEFSFVLFVVFTKLRSAKARGVLCAILLPEQLDGDAGLRNSR